MIELEDRLRATLTELANGVPESQHPADDFKRRLAARRRRPLLAAAAAAVLVIAGVTVPMMLGGTPRVDRPAAPEVVQDTGRHVLGTFTENGSTYEAIVSLRGDELCVGRSDQPDIAGCEPVPTWPTPDTDALVTTRGVLDAGMPDSGPLPHLLLFIAAPEVATLEVRAAYDTPVNLRMLEQTSGLTLYVADFGGSSQGFGYTAKNASGAVLEEAIT